MIASYLIGLASGLVLGVAGCHKVSLWWRWGNANGADGRSYQPRYRYRRYRI